MFSWVFADRGRVLIISCPTKIVIQGIYLDRDHDCFCWPSAIPQGLPGGIHFKSETAEYVFLEDGDSGSLVDWENGKSLYIYACFV